MQTLGKTEKIVLLVVFAALVAVYAAWIDFRFLLGQADSAFLAQMVDRMAATGRPVSQVAEAIRYLFLGFQPFLLMTPADEVCALNLVGPGPAEFNFFHWHTLISLYLYVPLFRLVGGEVGLSLLTATSFLMVNLGAYVLLRKHGVSILFSGLVAVLLMLHPVWSGGVLGQFYADRLWIGPAFVLCALLFTGRFASPWVIPLSILLTLTSERMGGVVGALLIGAVVLKDWRSPRAWWQARWVIATGIACAGFSAFIFHNFELHPYYESFRESMQLDNFLRNLKEYPRFAENLLLFVAINLLAWGLPALGFWRGLLLAVGVMFPNLVGNGGGAEKTGFFTHYHSLYFPVLAVALCLSFAWLYTRCARWLSWVFVGWLCVAGFAYNLNVNRFDFAFADLASRSFSYPFKGYHGERRVVAQRKELAAYLDRFPGTTVSTPEGLMPALYRHHRIAFYPMGLDTVDFVVIRKSYLAPDVFAGGYSYLGADDIGRLDACLSRRLLDSGYRVRKEFGDAVVLSRTQ